MKKDISKKYYERLDKELFEDHSIAALIILLNIGFELEFYYKEIPYSITKLNGNLFLSSPEKEETQSFNEMDMLVTNAIIDGQIFIEIWDEIILKDLF